MLLCCQEEVMEENKTFMPPPPPMELRQNRTSQQETSHPVEGNDLSLQEEALNLQPFSEAENVEEDISEEESIEVTTEEVSYDGENND